MRAASARAQVVAHNVFVPPKVAEKLELAEDTLPVHEIAEDIFDALDGDPSLRHRVVS